MEYFVCGGKAEFENADENAQTDASRSRDLQVCDNSPAARHLSKGESLANEWTSHDTQRRHDSGLCSRKRSDLAGQRNLGAVGDSCRQACLAWNNGRLPSTFRQRRRSRLASPARRHLASSVCLVVADDRAAQRLISDDRRPIRAARRLHAGQPRPAERTPRDHRHTWRRLETIQQRRLWLARRGRLCAGWLRGGLRPTTSLSAPGSPTWPENLEDVQAAVRWVRSNAGQLGVNPNEIVAMGESAGANLAALLGRPFDSELRSRRSVGRRRRRRVFDADRSDDPLQRESPCGARGRAIPGGFSRASRPRTTPRPRRSTRFRPATRPMLLIHGRQDPLIPVSQSEECTGRAHRRRRCATAHTGQWGTQARFPAALSRADSRCARISRCSTWDDVRHASSA